MLTLIHTGAPPGTRGLHLAAAHLQHAMAHLNSAARARRAPVGEFAGLEELRSIVYALNDLLIDVATLDRRLPSTDEVAAPGRAQKCVQGPSIRNPDAVRMAGSA